MRTCLLVFFTAFVSTLAGAQSAPPVNPFKRTVALPQASAIAVTGVARAKQAAIVAARPALEKKENREPVVIEEQVQGTRIGRVGDTLIFRGQGTYLYQAVSEVKIVRKLVKPDASAPAASGTAYAPGTGRMALPPNGIGAVPAPAFAGMAPPFAMGLPSSVGRPTPSAATAVVMPPAWGSSTPDAITATTPIPPAVPSSAPKAVSNSNTR